MSLHARSPPALVLSLVGWALLLAVPVVAVFELLAPTVPAWTAVGAVATPVAVGYWYTGRSVTALGAVVFRLTVAGLCVAVAVPAGALLSGVTPAPGPPTTTQLELTGVTAAYLLAAVWHRHGRLLFGTDATLTPGPAPDDRHRPGAGDSAADSNGDTEP